MTKVKSTEYILEQAINGLLENRRKEVRELGAVVSAVVSFASETKHILDERLSLIEAQITDNLSELKEKYDSLYKSLQKESKKISEALVADVKGNVEARLNKAIQQFNSELARMRLEHQHGMDYLYDRVSSLEDGAPGKDADERGIELRLYQRLRDEYIEPLEKEIQELTKRLSERKYTFGGGGNSDSNVRFSLGRVIKKETPTGAINGSNTVYTVTQDIHAVISFVINGEAITDDSYSVSGKTITFTTPLPSELSGTSFRIVYA